MQFPVRLPKLHRFLTADADLQPVVAKARDIRALAKLCQGFLPEDLSSQILAVIPKDHKLVVVAANSSAAAKLKLLAENLSHFLMKQGWKVNSVSVRVQPNWPVKLDVAVHKKKVLPASGLAELARLHRHLSNSPVRDALERLLEHHAYAPVNSPATPSVAPGRAHRPGRPRRPRS